MIHEIIDFSHASYGRRTAIWVLALLNILLILFG